MAWGGDPQEPLPAHPPAGRRSEDPEPGREGERRREKAGGPRRGGPAPLKPGLGRRRALPRETDTPGLRALARPGREAALATALAQLFRGFSTSQDWHCCRAEVGRWPASGPEPPLPPHIRFVSIKKCPQMLPEVSWGPRPREGGTTWPFVNRWFRGRGYIFWCLLQQIFLKYFRHFGKTCLEWI